MGVHIYASQAVAIHNDHSMPTTTDLRSFQTTRWSVVRRALGNDDDTASKALASICAAYWYPIFAYFRRGGKSVHDAEDLTQGFFAKLLAGGTLMAADPERGRLRTFLLACARNYQRDEWDRSMSQKRAGRVMPFDLDLAEERYVAETVDTLTPDRLFQRCWALGVLQSSLQSLADEYTSRGQAEIFEKLRPFLGFGSDPEKHYGEVASELAMPLGTLKNRVFRMRERWRELLFDHVGRTLSDPSPEEIKAELSELLAWV